MRTAPTTLALAAAAGLTSGLVRLARQVAAAIDEVEVPAPDVAELDPLRASRPDRRVA